MSNLEELSALTALNNMMLKGWFDICVIDKVGALLGVDPRGRAYTILTPLHCVHFDKMPDELRKAIPGLIQECLGMAPIFQFKTVTPIVIEVVSPAQATRPSFLQLLRGKDR